MRSAYLVSTRTITRYTRSWIEHVRHVSGGRFDYAEGTVYPALHRLEGRGLLRSSWSDVEGRRRRVYELTTKGRGALAEQDADWRRFVRTLDAVLAQ